MTTQRILNPVKGRILKIDGLNLSLRNFSVTKTTKFRPSKTVSTTKVVKITNKDTKGLITQNFKLLNCVFTKTLPALKEPDIIRFVECVTLAHNNFIRNLGVKFGTKHYKAITNYSILLCEGRYAEPVSRVSTGRTDKWPNCFGALRPIYRAIIDDGLDKTTRAEYFRLLLTLFKLNKVSKDFSEMELEDIIKDFEIDKSFMKDFESYLITRLPKTDRLTNLTSLKVKPIFGPANGPNGMPKIESSRLEALALVNSELYKPFKKVCELTENISFMEYIEAQAKIENIEPSIMNKGIGKSKVNRKVTLRKLVSIADKANKSRIVAICDFWTQSLLAPLEKNEEIHLKQCFKDKSSFYSHSDGFNKAIANSNNEWVSLDASSWTDNFPVTLQHIYLKVRYGVEFADSWLALAANCKWTVANTDLTVRYGKGQGMGTKGSFMIASVTDHYVIEYILSKHYGQVKPYLKVGDDLIVEDSDNILSKFYPTIGVPINLSKSKFTTPRGHFMEYVSRNSWDKLDISPISPNLITKALKQPYVLVILLNHLNERCSVRFQLEDLIESIGLKAVERYNLYKLVDLYQRLSGEVLCTIPTDIVVFTNDQYFRILVKIIEHSIKEFLSNSTDSIIDNEIIYLNQLSLFSKSGSLYVDDWVMYNKEGLDLKDIKIFKYFEDNVFSPFASQKTALPVIPDGTSILILDENGNVTKELNKFIFDTLIKSHEELQRYSNVSSIIQSASSSPKAFIELFKTLNSISKYGDSAIKYRMTFEPYDSIVRGLCGSITVPINVPNV